MLWQFSSSNTHLAAIMIYLTSVLILSASATSTAFVQVGPAPKRTAPLHATESFQRSLLAERLGTGVDPAAKKQQEEQMHRALLEAKLANDKINAALGTTPTAKAEVAEQSAAAPEPEPSEAKGPGIINLNIDKDSPKVATMDKLSEGEKKVYCRCWQSDTFPLCDGSHMAHNKATGDNVGPLIVSVDKAPVPEAVTPEPVVSAPLPPPAPVPAPAPAKKVIKRTEFTVPRELAIVPVNEATVQFTAGALGAAAGLALGGPILGAVGAGAFNYLSRKDDDKSSDNPASAKKIVDTASQTALYAFNFLAQFDRDNKVVDSLLKVLEKVVDKAKESEGAGDALATVESTLGGIASKVEELNDDYDLVGGAGTVLNSVGDLVEISVDKVVEANDEYKLTDRVGGVVKGAVEKVL